MWFFVKCSNCKVKQFIKLLSEILTWICTIHVDMYCSWISSIRRFFVVRKRWSNRRCRCDRRPCLWCYIFPRRRSSGFSSYPGAKMCRMPARYVGCSFRFRCFQYKTTWTSTASTVPRLGNISGIPHWWLLKAARCRITRGWSSCERDVAPLKTIAGPCIIITCLKEKHVLLY